MSSYIPALRRQWLIVVAGVIFASAAAYAALATREPSTYTATARLLVTGAEAPYIRTSVTRTEQVQRDPADGTEGGRVNVTRGGTTIVSTGPPDVAAYIRAANLYPLLVESDQVRAERERLYGPSDGKVTARAIYSVSMPSRFTLSEVPVIQVFGEADTAVGAVKLTKQTADAFVSWMTAQQKAAQVPPRSRILIQQLQEPRSAAASPRPSAMLGALAFAGVLFAFGVLAIVVDRLRSHEQTGSAQIAAPPPAPIAAAADVERASVAGAAAGPRAVKAKSGPTLGG